VIKVFIADDSSEVRERIRMLLSELEKVEMIGEAENVQEAIENIRQKGPDVVILDIRMPGGNGIDVLREIEKNDQVPIIIMLTNYPHQQYRKKCMDAGADFFFDKSKEFEKVVEVLNNQIQQKDCKLQKFS
jgi:DNA-binding NarL/FixJ family response regulator